MSKTIENKQDEEKVDIKPKTLSVEALEARIAPALAADKKDSDPPYPPGTKYGLIRRDSLAG